MSFELSPEEGKFLIKLARTSVKEYLEDGKKFSRQKIRRRSFLSSVASS